MKKSIIKNPGEKVIKVSLETDMYKIKKIEIKGDFFIYPEESIELLENDLVGVDIDREVLEEKIKACFAGLKASLYGISVDGIMQGIIKCLD